MKNGKALCAGVGGSTIDHPFKAFEYEDRLEDVSNSVHDHRRDLCVQLFESHERLVRIIDNVRRATATRAPHVVRL